MLNSPIRPNEKNRVQKTSTRYSVNGSHSLTPTPFSTTPNATRTGFGGVSSIQSPSVRYTHVSTPYKRTNTATAPIRSNKVSQARLTPKTTDVVGAPSTTRNDITKIKLDPSPITCIEVVDGEYYTEEEMEGTNTSNENTNNVKHPALRFGASVWTCHQDGSISLRRWRDGTVCGSILTPLYHSPDMSSSNTSATNTTSDQKDQVAKEIITAMTHVQKTGQVWCATSLGRILIYGARTRKLLKEVKYHASCVNCMIYSDNFVFTASDDSTIAKWNAKTYKLATIYAEHSAAVKCVALFHSDKDVEERILISAGRDKSIRFWSCETGRCLNSITLNEDKNINDICVQGSYLWVASDNASIYIWDLKVMALERQLRVHDASVNCLTSLGSEVWSTSEDKTVCIWNSLTFELIHRMSASHKDPISCIKRIARADTYRIWTVDKYRVRMWDEQCAFNFNHMYCYDEHNLIPKGNVSVDASIESVIMDSGRKVAYTHKNLLNKIHDLESQLKQVQHNNTEVEFKRIKQENEVLRKENEQLVRIIRISEEKVNNSELNENESISILQKAYEVVELQSQKQNQLDNKMVIIQKENESLKKKCEELLGSQKELSKKLLSKELYINEFYDKLYSALRMEQIAQKPSNDRRIDVISLIECQSSQLSSLQDYNSKLQHQLQEIMKLIDEKEQIPKGGELATKPNSIQKIAGRYSGANGTLSPNKNDKVNLQRSKLEEELISLQKENQILRSKLSTVDQRSPYRRNSSHYGTHTEQADEFPNLSTTELIQLNAEITSLRKKTEEIIKEKEQNSTQVGTLSNQVLELEKERNILRDQIMSTIQVMKQIFDRIPDSVQPGEGEADVYARRLLKQIDEHLISLQHKITDTQTKIQELEETIERTESQLKTMRSSLSNSSVDDIPLDQLAADVYRLYDHRIQRLTEQLDQVEKESDDLMDLELKIEKYETEIEILRNELAFVKKTMKSTNNKSRQEETILHKFKTEELEQAKIILQRIMDVMELPEETINGDVSLVDVCSIMHNAVRMRLDRTNNELKLLELACQNLEKQFSESSEKLLRATHTIQDLSSQKLSLEKQVEISRTRVSDLVKQNRTISAMLDEARDEAETRSKDLVKLEKQYTMIVHKLESEKTELVDEIHTSLNKLGDLRILLGENGLEKETENSLVVMINCIGLEVQRALKHFLGKQEEQQKEIHYLREMNQDLLNELSDSMQRKENTHSSINQEGSVNILEQVTEEYSKNNVDSLYDASELRMHKTSPKLFERDMYMNESQTSLIEELQSLKKNLGEELNASQTEACILQYRIEALESQLKDYSEDVLNSKRLLQSMYNNLPGIGYPLDINGTLESLITAFQDRLNIYQSYIETKSCSTELNERQPKETEMENNSCLSEHDIDQQIIDLTHLNTSYEHKVRYLEEVVETDREKRRRMMNMTKEALDVIQETLSEEDNLYEAIEIMCRYIKDNCEKTKQLERIMIEKRTTLEEAKAYLLDMISRYSKARMNTNILPSASLIDLIYKFTKMMIDKDSRRQEAEDQLERVIEACANDVRLSKETLLDTAYLLSENDYEALKQEELGMICVGIQNLVIEKMTELHDTKLSLANEEMNSSQYEIQLKKIVEDKSNSHNNYTGLKTAIQKIASVLGIEGHHIDAGGIDESLEKILVRVETSVSLNSRMKTIIDNLEKGMACIADILTQQCYESNIGKSAPHLTRDIYSDEEWKLVTDILQDIEITKRLLEGEETKSEKSYHLLKLRVSEACLTMINLKKMNDELMTQIQSISVDKDSILIDNSNELSDSCKGQKGLNELDQTDDGLLNTSKLEIERLQNQISDAMSAIRSIIHSISSNLIESNMALNEEDQSILCLSPIAANQGIEQSFIDVDEYSSDSGSLPLLLQRLDILINKAFPKYK